ncbi:MAG: GntR family transcriptional regulator [Tyzzerella sp.]|nr:GntR family transcriptional regulator [Tyzzerella sp.]
MEEHQDYSLRGRVFQAIQENILNGVYKENEELRENTIAKELGVSRTPVREALRQLELEGLVKIVPNKGACVTGITKNDVKDIYAIRSLLEGLCARWATEHITDAQVDELEEIILLSEFHLKRVKEGQTQQVTELDGKFHEILYEASNSRILKHVLSDFHKYVRMVRKASVANPERAERSIEEHKDILHAIKNRDANAAEILANAHMMNVMKNLNMKEDI